MFDNIVVDFEMVEERFVDVGKFLLFDKIFVVSDEEIRSEEFS